MNASGTAIRIEVCDQGGGQPRRLPPERSGPRLGDLGAPAGRPARAHLLGGDPGEGPVHSAPWGMGAQIVTASWSSIDHVEIDGAQDVVVDLDIDGVPAGVDAADGAVLEAVPAGQRDRAPATSDIGAASRRSLQSAAPSTIHRASPAAPNTTWPVRCSSRRNRRGRSVRPVSAIGRPRRGRSRLRTLLWRHRSRRPVQRRACGDPHVVGLAVGLTKTSPLESEFGDQGVRTSKIPSDLVGAVGLEPTTVGLKGRRSSG
jgi:hypothetical protein